MANVMFKQLDCSLFDCLDITEFPPTEFQQQELM